MVGKKLTAKPGSWTPADVTFTYQWLRNGEPIAGATGSKYKLKNKDKGKKISVTVTGAEVRLHLGERHVAADQEGQAEAAALTAAWPSGPRGWSSGRDRGRRLVSMSACPDPRPTQSREQHDLLPGLVRARVRPTRKAAAAAEPVAEVDPVARVLVDVPLAHLDRTFDYGVPASMAEDARPGVRVKVRFAGRDVDGFVARAGRRAPTTTGR